MVGLPSLTGLPETAPQFRQTAPDPRNTGIAAGGPPQRQPIPRQVPQGIPQPQMNPGQMNPGQMSPGQMIAGLSVVDDDIEKLNLDIPTKIMLKERELLNLVQSIQNDKMMQQQPPMQTIDDQQKAQVSQLGLAAMGAPDMSNIMRGGGIVGYTGGGRIGKAVRGYAAGDLVEETPAPSPWEERQLDVYEQLMNNTYDVEEEASRAATQYDASMRAAIDAQQQRQTDLNALRNARAERFSAEREKQARRREGLARFAREGWGGYSAGSSEAEERFSTGRLQAATDNFQNQTAVVNYLTEQGVNRNSAIESARNAAMEAKNGNLQSAATIVNNAINARTQIKVADIYANQQRSPTNLQEQIDIEVAYLRGLPENQDKSDAELLRQAMHNVSIMNARAALSRVEQTGTGQSIDVRRAAMEMVEDAIGIGGSRYREYMQAADKEGFEQNLFNTYVRALSAYPDPNQGAYPEPYQGAYPEPNPNPTQGAYPEPDEFAINYLRSNPNTRTEFDKVHGPGAAEKIIGPE